MIDDLKLGMQSLSDYENLKKDLMSEEFKVLCTSLINYAISLIHYLQELFHT